MNLCLSVIRWLFFFFAIDKEKKLKSYNASEWIFSELHFEHIFLSQSRQIVERKEAKEKPCCLFFFFSFSFIPWFCSSKADSDLMSNLTEDFFYQFNTANGTLQRVCKFELIEMVLTTINSVNIVHICKDKSKNSN